MQRDFPLTGKVDDRINYYEYEAHCLKDYRSSSNVIVNKKYLKYIRNIRYEEEKYVPPSSLDWYPRCNAYYPYTEDVDAINRVDHLKAAKTFLESFTTIKPDDTEIFDSFTIDDIHQKYLLSKPASFLILGKPGIGEDKLAKLLAEYWRCVYIDPEILITQEIESGSRAGQCIEFNLRCGRAIAVDVILRLLEKRVRSKSAVHRGFVICGFPLIRNYMFQEDPVSSESAVFTVHDIFEEILEPIGATSPVLKNVSEMSHTSELGEEQTTTLEVEATEFEEPEDIESLNIELAPSKRSLPNIAVDIGSTTSQMCKMIDIGSNYASQVNFLFNLCQQPLILIYIMCPNLDVVTKHENYRYSINDDSFINLLKDQTENIVYTLYTKTPGFGNEELPDNPLDVPDSTRRLNSSDQNYLMYLPAHFSGNIQKQLDDYRYLALPTIEKHVLLHNPQFFIKVDGRFPPTRMFNIVKTKLRILPIPSVVIPERLVEFEEPTGGEGDVAEVFDYETKTPLECFDELRNKKTVGRMYKLKWSRWGSSCPVAMKQGTYYEGKAKHAIKFLDRIFFLSEEEAVTKFIRNPRPYLLPPCPMSACKAFIVGPPTSGKTAVAKCLALLLDGNVLDSKSMHMDYSKQKEKQYIDKLRSHALNEGLLLLKEQRQQQFDQKEMERRDLIEKWMRDAKEAIEERVLLDKRVMLEAMTGAQITAFPLKGVRSIGPEIFEKYKTKIEAARQQMLELELDPYFEDIEYCERLCESSEELRLLLPERFKVPTPTPQPPNIFDSFVSQYANDRVDNRERIAFDTSDDLVDMYLTAIRETEEKNTEAGLRHGGWIVDGMVPDPEILDVIFEEFIPNDLLIFHDSSTNFLLERYKIKGQNEYKSYYQFFQTLGKPDVAIRTPSLISTVSYKTRLARSILDDALTDNRMDVNESASNEESFFDEDEHDEFIDEDYFATHATRLALRQYQNELRKYETQYVTLLEYLDGKGIPYNVIDVADKSVENLMKEVIKYVDNRYQQRAHEVTPEERVEEVDDYGEPPMAGEDIGEEEAGPTDDADSFFKNRRLGMTNMYCPVSYGKHWVLWKGREEFAAKFNGDMYFMSSEDALKSFLKDPLDYLHTKPPERLPPPRICIVGVQGSGKTSLAEKLSRELGLYYVSFDKLLKGLVNEEHNPIELEVLMSSLSDSIEANIILNYLDKEQPLPEDILDRINLKKYWIEEPIKSTGFVMDGYPRRPSDIEYMETNYLIPDIILELTCNSMEVNRRRVQKLTEEWKILTEHQLEEQEKAYLEAYANWDKSRKIRIEELMEIKRQERYQNKIKELKETPLSTVQEVNEDEDERLTNRSQVSYNSVAEEADLEEITNIVNSEYVEPLPPEEMETLEEATDRFIARAQQEYTSGLQFYNLLKEVCHNTLIEWAFINADLWHQKVIDQAMMAVDKIYFRNYSILERCYEITVETAEQLISNGYYFLSRFGKVCPVQLYEKENCVHMFIPMEQKFELFPIIHSHHIYFIAGKANKEKFIDHPLKYIFQRNVNFQIIPFRIAIIGPPKCGKTALAERFKRDFGMKYISIGQAVRYVLRYLPFSKLATDMDEVLRKGWELTSEMMIKCVEIMTYDGRGVTQGVVFDGFPNTIYDVKHLAAIGLVPQVVFFLDADAEDIDEYLSTDKGKRGLPAFNRDFIHHRLSVWNDSVDEFTNWFDREYQVWTKLRVKHCKWGIWEEAFKIAYDVLYEIKSYFKNCHREMGLYLGNMQITPVEFEGRRSSFKQYCPCCLHYDSILISGGDPPDRTGLVQYKELFYWLCHKHLKEFSEDPPAYLSPYNKSVLPADLPLRLNLDSKPEKCYETGYCIVCYWDGQPESVVHTGDIKFACTYRDITYLFDSEECLQLFMIQPTKYFQKGIHYKGKSLVPLDFTHLPIQGFLEQYVIKEVVRAMNNTGLTRPVLPGLGIEKSAAINVGLQLKVYNENIPEEVRKRYRIAREKFNKRRLDFIDHLAIMKKSINPYLHYEEPLEPLVLPETRRYESSVSSASEHSIEDKSLGSVLQQIMQYMKDTEGG